MSTGIAWCDKTANPFYATGGDVSVEDFMRGWHCEKVSPGCAHCFSEAQNVTRRFDMGTGLPFSPASWGKLILHIDEKMLKSWKRAKKGKRIFVNSMTDTFGEWWPDEFRYRAFEAMEQSQHTFLVLTKRAKEQRAFVKAGANNMHMPANVWPGVSVESPKYLWRVEELLATPAAHRFVSYEPALEYVDFRPYLGPGKVSWLIFGGESGPKARAVEGGAEEVARDIIGQCRDMNIPCFIKQLGTVWARLRRSRTSHGTDPSEWPELLRVQQFPQGTGGTRCK